MADAKKKKTNRTRRKNAPSDHQGALPTLSLFRHVLPSRFYWTMVYSSGHWFTPPPCPSLGRRFCSGAKPAAAPAVAAMHIWSVAWTRPNLALGSLIKYLKAADRAKAAPPSPWRRSRAGAAKRESQTCPARAEKNGAKIDRHRVIRRRFTDGFT